jgi:hypothetical protein
MNDTIFDHTCGVSRCDQPTQDIICRLCADQLATTLSSVARYVHSDAPEHRVVLVANRGDEAPGTEAPTAEPTKPVEIDVQHSGLWEDLDVTLTRQDRMPRAPRAGSSSGSPWGFSLRAFEAKGQLEWTVNFWVYAFANANQHLTFDPFRATIPEKCAWLAQFPGLIATLPGAADAWRDITRAIVAATQAVDGQAVRGLIARCGEPVLNEDGEEVPCQGGVFALEDARLATCASCGAIHLVDDQRQRLVEELLTKTGTPTEIARAFAAFGYVVSPNSIRTWARARVESRRLQPAGWTDTKPPHPVYRFCDVAERAGFTQRNETNTQVDLAEAA